jgi:uncharacterized protein
MISIVNITRKSILAKEVEIRSDMLGRLRGWLFQKAPTSGTGLYLKKCMGVHTLGMFYPIDAVYIDRHGKILKCLTLQPFGLGPIDWHTYGVLELVKGSCQASFCQTGDQLQIYGAAW